MIVPCEFCDNMFDNTDPNAGKVMPEANMCKACCDWVEKSWDKNTAIEEIEAALDEECVDCDYFSSALSYALELLKLSDKDFANRFGLSRTSVKRWCKGKNIPTRAMQKPMLWWLLARVNELCCDDRPIITQQPIYSCDSYDVSELISFSENVHGSLLIVPM